MGQDVFLQETDFYFHIFPPKAHGSTNFPSEPLGPPQGLRRWEQSEGNEAAGLITTVRETWRPSCRKQGPGRPTGAHGES